MFLRFTIFLCLSAMASARADVTADVIVAVGEAGAEGYKEGFASAVESWKKVGTDGGANVAVVESLEKFEESLAVASKDSASPLWVALIGHGTFNSRVAKFNFAGDDLSAEGLGALLKDFKRPLIVINGTSCSGPFIPAVSAPDRVVITATKSGTELNFARFGGAIAESIASPEADLDNDGQNSAFECFLHASRQVKSYYEREGLIATEHAMIDDNGDGRGTTADSFDVVGEKPRKKQPIDGDYARLWSLQMNEEERKLSAEQRKQRNGLEREVFALRRKKTTIDSADYYGKLEKLMLEIAGIYTAADGGAEEENPEGEDESVEEKAADEEGSAVTPPVKVEIPKDDGEPKAGAVESAGDAAPDR